MNTDRELLELAAKAAGYSVRCVGNGIKDGPVQFYMQPSQLYWNPLTDDGDALRLAVKLEIAIVFIGLTVRARAPEYWQNEIEMCEIMTGDPAAKARRAIVRAAARIGEKA